MENPISKKELRTFWKKKCATLAERKNSSLCCKTLFSLLVSFPKVLSFFPLPLEIDITECNKKLALEKRLYLPRVSSDRLEICPLFEFSDLSLGPFCLEPNTSPISLSEIDLILLPALVFDKSCYRLGYGKGFYDRLLSDRKVRTLGIGFKEQLIDKIPHEEHDIPLDALLLF